MTKQDLARKVAEELDLSYKDAHACVRAVFDALRDGLSQEREVKISSFGKFTVFTRNARRIPDVSNGQMRKVDAHPQISFRASPNLKLAL